MFQFLISSIYFLIDAAFKRQTFQIKLMESIRHPKDLKVPQFPVLMHYSIS